MAPEPTFSGAHTSEVKIKLAEKQRKYYRHIKLV